MKYKEINLLQKILRSIAYSNMLDSNKAKLSMKYYVLIQKPQEFCKRDVISVS